MKKIFFVTENKQKFLWAQRRMEEFGINLKHKKMEISEIKDFNLSSVLIAKSEFVKKQVHKPFIVEDSGFYIKCLNGFPGPFIKLAVNILGIDNIVYLTKKYNDKSAFFRSGLIFSYKNEDKIFFVQGEGKITAPKGNNTRKWGDLSRVYIPNGWKKTLAQMTDSEWESFMENITKDDHYTKFMRWLSGRI